jgi:hypothetical protein
VGHGLAFAACEEWGGKEKRNRDPRLGSRSSGETKKVQTGQNKYAGQGRLSEQYGSVREANDQGLPGGLTAAYGMTMPDWGAVERVAMGVAAPAVQARENCDQNRIGPIAGPRPPMLAVILSVLRHAADPTWNALGSSTGQAA